MLRNQSEAVNYEAAGEARSIKAALRRVWAYSHLKSAVVYGTMALGFFFFVLDSGLAAPVRYPGVVQGGVWKRGEGRYPDSWALVVATPYGRETVPVNSVQWNRAKKGQRLTVLGKRGYFTSWRYTGSLPFYFNPPKNDL